jgi:hypothetical protein
VVNTLLHNGKKLIRENSVLILKTNVMKELSFEKMECIEGGSWISSIDGLCAAFGISCLISDGILLAVPRMQVLGVGCAGWAVGRAAGLV